MFFPQRPLLAPGSSLRQQLAYPAADASRLSNNLAFDLLKQVELDYLMDRVSSDLDLPTDWAGASAPFGLRDASNTQT